MKRRQSAHTSLEMPPPLQQFAPAMKRAPQQLDAYSKSNPKNLYKWQNPLDKKLPDEAEKK